MRGLVKDWMEECNRNEITSAGLRQMRGFRKEKCNITKAQQQR